jgi:S-adenosylmethionine:tRNA ribosyltransferase-isomerase
MHPSNLRIEDYTYALPDERIARYPLPVRDASKLLIVSAAAMQEDVYRNLPPHIPSGSLLVFNQTKVVNARLMFYKASGSAIEVFCLAPAPHYPDIQTAMLQKGTVEWECLVGGASKWKPGVTLQIVNDEPAFTLSASIIARNPSSFTLSLSWNDQALTFAEVLHHVGKVPLPPYLHREAEPIDQSTYQTTYARDEGSVAAPTAGLHFTPALFQAMEARGISSAFLTLHVGAGTFRPVKADTMAGHDMHAEWIEADRAMLQQLADITGTKLIAVGTTSLRTLESLYWLGVKLLKSEPIDWQGIAIHQWYPYETDVAYTPAEAMQALINYLDKNGLPGIITRTQILIAPGYRFRMIDALITNFHQPKSTLLLLVAALIGNQWRDLYQYALDNDFRFLSYGDGSLIWNPHPVH